MSQRKLLLADDSITIQKVVNLTFADEGIEVLTVGDGDTAMEKLDGFKPDLIMADVNMPGLNGYQICEKIKQSEDFGKTPVILLVGSFEPFDESEAARVGADDFLTKPFQSIRQLVSKVTELLDSDKKTKDSASSEFAENSPEEAKNKVSGAASEKFDGAEPDDEMIQTNQPGGFMLDERSKFETREEPAEDWAKTETLSSEELRHGSSVSEEAGKATIFKQKFSRPAAAEFDDDDLLEIPFDEDEETETEPKVSPVNTAESAAAENQAVETRQPESLAAEQNQTAAAARSSSELSTETIDLIVQKVVERLSDKAVREIAWEVVPQMTDLIVKKMAEEKLKES